MQKFLPIIVELLIGCKLCIIEQLHLCLMFLYMWRATYEASLGK